MAPRNGGKKSAFMDKILALSRRLVVLGAAFHPSAGRVSEKVHVTIISSSSPLPFPIFSNTYTHTHTHTLSLSLSLSHTHTHTHIPTTEFLFLFLSSGAGRVLNLAPSSVRRGLHVREVLVRRVKLDPAEEEERIFLPSKPADGTKAP
jgi:hypothetical protein